MNTTTFLSLLLFITSNLNAADYYSRIEFGYGWVDEDSDCQNTRQEILIRDAIDGTIELDEDGCIVVSGWWVDPYSGKIIDDPSDIDIDHIVPLKWGYLNGAYKWTREKRIQFANDPNNLTISHYSENRSKGAKGPCEWMPTDESYHKVYIHKWNEVVDEYWNK